MIVSHKHRFIFIKTAKTGGSSIERALGPRCGPKDIVAGPARESRQARNWRRGLGRLGWHIPGGIARFFPQISGFYPHMPAHQVRAMVGEKIWESYYKFSVERNPWDRQVSLYFYRVRDKSPERDFAWHLTSRWARATRSVYVPNWEAYTIGGDIAVDRVIRYERLEDEFADVCRTIGIRSAVRLPRVNVGPRDGRKPYRDYYDDRTREVVADWYAREIGAFGYAF